MHLLFRINIRSRERRDAHQSQNPGILLHISMTKETSRDLDTPHIAGWKVDISCDERNEHLSG